MVHSWQTLQALHHFEYEEYWTVSFCAAVAAGISDCNTQAFLSSTGYFDRASIKIPGILSSLEGLKDLHEVFFPVIEF